MSARVRNVEVDAAQPLRDWPYEALVTLVERGTVSDWVRLTAEIDADPWGPVSRQVEEYLRYEQPYGVARSGLTVGELAGRLGTSRSRLSTYRSGRVVPSATFLVRLRQVVDAPAPRGDPAAASRSGGPPVHRSETGRATRPRERDGCRRPVCAGQDPPVPVTAEDLRQLDPEALGVLLSLRPDVLGPTEPLSLEEVAARLSHRASLERALRRLDTPTLQVARALVQLGCHSDPTALPRFLRLSGSAELEVLDSCLHVLDHLLLREDCGCLADRLAEGWNPYGLGPPLLRALGWRTNDRLREALRQWGEPTGGDKLALVERLAALLTDVPRLRQALSDAPAGDRGLLDTAARGDGTVTLGWTTPRGGRETGAWLIGRGFVDGGIPGPAQMPAEVVIALRGASWRPPFDWQEPAMPTSPVDREQVDREAAAAAARSLRLVTDLVREAGARPVRLNRDGTLGKRERARLAAALLADPAHVSFAVALAYAAGLLAVLDDGLSPPPEASGWATLPPAQRHAELVLTWLETHQAVLSDPDVAWWPMSHLTPAPGRHVVLQVLAGTPEAVPVDSAGLLRRCAWHAPVVLGAEDGDALVAGTLAEATLLGVLGAGALSSLGHAVVTSTDLEPVLDGWLGAPTATARLQGDLTAVVLGDPAPRLARVLDLLATRERSDQATTWRFDARSVARALDAGHSVDGLLGALSAVAEGAVPQPLAYLVRDTGRRHGVLRAGGAACYLRSDDHALLAEVAADSRLRPLGLRLLAPGVLVGEQPLDRTLERLRGAGYLPLDEDTRGRAAGPGDAQALVEVPGPAASVSSVSSVSSGPTDPEDAVDVAAQVLGLPDRAPAPLLQIAGSVVDSRSVRSLIERQVRGLNG